MTECPECSYLNSDEAELCEACGSTLTRECGEGDLGAPVAGEKELGKTREERYAGASIRLKTYYETGGFRRKSADEDGEPESAVEESPPASAASDGDPVTDATTVGLAAFPDAAAADYLPRDADGDKRELEPTFAGSARASSGGRRWSKPWRNMFGNKGVVYFGRGPGAGIMKQKSKTEAEKVPVGIRPPPTGAGVDPSCTQAALPMELPAEPEPAEPAPGEKEAVVASPTGEAEQSAPEPETPAEAVSPEPALAEPAVSEPEAPRPRPRRKPSARKEQAPLPIEMEPPIPEPDVSPAPTAPARAPVEIAGEDREEKSRAAAPAKKKVTLSAPIDGMPQVIPEKNNPL